MLGRRAAVGASMLVLAVTGGSALAATHGSSTGSKPDVQKGVRQHKTVPAVVHTGHNCPFSHGGGAGISASQL